MTSQGQYNQSGINAQNWAAMSLFLQYITFSDFRHIGFEGNELEDFHLVFADGHKIICESKSGKVGLSQIRKILDNILKHGQLTEQDEILIIAKEVDSNAKGLIENFKYFTDQVKRELQNKQHKFKDAHLQLLPQLKFWEVGKDTNISVVRLMMARVINYPESFWVPEHRLNEITNDLVIEKVYNGSAKGETLTREDFLKLIREKKQQILSDDGSDYEKERQTDENEVKDVIKAVKKKDRKLNINNEITKIYANPSILHFALQKLALEKSLNLVDWDNFWKATIQSAFSIELFKIFENNIQGKQNQEYAIDFTLSSIGKTSNYFREEFIKYDIIKLCTSILNTAPQFETKLFEIIKKLYEHSIEKFLYVKRRSDDSWEREEAAKLLYEIYSKSKNDNFKNEVIKYILEKFNVVEDDGKFWHYTPPQLFDILSDYVNKNASENVLWFSNIASDQFQKYYGRYGTNIKFEGWEHMGGGISQAGSGFSISDRHFVTRILRPALTTIYETDREKGWKFITTNCITRKMNDVNKDKPDFLNRAVIGILFQEYKGGKHDEEAFEILADYVRMRKGIPWKADLVFQELRGDYTDQQKWNLVKVSLDEYKNLPVNVFVEMIVSDLASKSEDKELRKLATETIKSWATDPEYQKRHNYGELDTVDSAIKLINNPDSRNEGIDILEKYIESEHFKTRRDTFDTYDVANTLTCVLEEDFERGLKILDEVNKSSTLSINQQILITSSLYKTNDNKPEILKAIFDRFLKPLLSSLVGKKVANLDLLNEEDIKPIEKRFSYRYARESLVQFSEKLARAGYKQDSLWMVKIFINDSDPPKDGSNYPDDPKGELNEHARVAKGEKDLAIRTVRGYLAWTLQKLVVPFGEAGQKITRELIPECVQIVKRLCNDSNYYVRAEACIPLIELVKNRHTHLPGKDDERFISEEVAEEIETVAFNMLTKENINLKQIARHLAIVFSYMRTLGTEKAMKVLQTFLTSDEEEVVDEILPLLIYYSLFRKDAFPKWPWRKLEPFDPKKFEELLLKQLKDGNDTVKSRLAWQFERLPDEISKTPEEKRTLSVKGAVELSARYLNEIISEYNHNVYDDVYRFVEDYYGKYFDTCFDIWKKCIDIESDYFKKNWDESKLQEMYWWPFFNNGKLLEAVLDHKGESTFLTYLKELAEYPTPVLIAHDLDIAVGRLTKITDQYKKVKVIFELLIKRDPKYYEYKLQWLNTKKRKRR